MTRRASIRGGWGYAPTPSNFLLPPFQPLGSPRLTFSSTPLRTSRIIGPSSLAGSGWPPTTREGAGAGRVALRKCGWVMSPHVRAPGWSRPAVQRRRAEGESLSSGALSNSRAVARKGGGERAKRGPRASGARTLAGAWLGVSLNLCRRLPCARFPPDHQPGLAARDRPRLAED